MVNEGRTSDPRITITLDCYRGGRGAEDCRNVPTEANQPLDARKSPDHAPGGFASVPTLSDYTC